MYYITNNNIIFMYSQLNLNKDGTQETQNNNLVFHGKKNINHEV